MTVNVWPVLTVTPLAPGTPGSAMVRLETVGFPVSTVMITPPSIVIVSPEAGIPPAPVQLVQFPPVLQFPVVVALQAAARASVT